MYPSIYGFGGVGDAAIGDPTTDRIPRVAMTTTLARAAPEKLNATLSSTTAKRLKAVVIRRSTEEENTKALKLRWWRI